MINSEVKKYIDKSVLCWLATVNELNEPNVSPKEVFTYDGEHTLLIANIASPVSIKNIRENPNVCVSFIDVFIQKGFKIKGTARVIEKKDAGFEKKAKLLTDLFTDNFPIISVIEVNVKKVDQIQAPSYFLYPDKTEQSQIESAMKTYKVKPID
ncbi:pyridoxamine 5'-phosphate oxidase family protein [Aquiflexum lacus]|uniref:pyridoxamine 5'-phosphate oxidase family protein n=1 Tax=Aquiflexum lacus TaxID=2483805 RepID=UPI0018952917|nr:pyridoxamine 5'-phosphate oxidase family protein [Aquiflexum lacus]